MTYQPLARKYRPARFEDLIGQNSVATALTNGIRMKREPRAVIFSGVRGIGKTTAARLYAKALNCDNGPTPEPCGTCVSCRAISSGVHEDVMEIDGASNTSVDDVRALRETVTYVPQRSRFKVYLIDEVHMLSNSAFNALLKTLEEPPTHVVFLFATTELHKIPQTIVSRCQTFYLKKFTTEELAGRIRHIISEEGFNADEQVVLEIARQGNGSMRDALTFLDTAIAVSGGALQFQNLTSLMGTVSHSDYIRFVELLVKRDANAIVTTIERFVSQGVELTTLCEETAAMCRHGFLLKELGSQGIDINRSGLSHDDVANLKRLGEAAPKLELNRIFRTLMQCRRDLEDSVHDRYVFENYCMEWCIDPGLPDLDQLMAQISNAPKSVQPVVRAGAMTQKPMTPAKEVVAAVTPTPPAAPVVETVAPVERPKISLSEQFKSAAAKPVEAVFAKKEAAPVESSVAASEPIVVAALSEETFAPLVAIVEEVSIPEPMQKIAPHVEVMPESVPIFESPAPEIAVPAIQAGASSEDVKFPATWREMVDVWRKQKPLQARIFEDSRGVQFSREEIAIAVDHSSLGGQKLLDPEIQSKLKVLLNGMFGFSGKFIVSRMDDEETAQAMPKQSILQEKQTEQSERKQKIREELESGPATKVVLDTFKESKVVGVNLSDSN
jgi:DNA polymerase-3 subunit gamma/tau